MICMGGMVMYVQMKLMIKYRFKLMPSVRNKRKYLRNHQSMGPMSLPSTQFARQEETREPKWLSVVL